MANNSLLDQKLDIIESELSNLKAAMLLGKKKIAEALIACGNGTVGPTEDEPDLYSTFEEYAKAILKLRNQSSMRMVFNLKNKKDADGAIASPYQRTLILPVNLSLKDTTRGNKTIANALGKMYEADNLGYAGVGLSSSGSPSHETAINYLALLIKEGRVENPVGGVSPMMGAPTTMEMGPANWGIGALDMMGATAFQDDNIYVPESASDDDANLPETEVTTFGDDVPLDEDILPEDEEMMFEQSPVTETRPVFVAPTIFDAYGNEINPGDWESDDFVPSMEEIETYLTESEQVEMLAAMQSLNIAPRMQSAPAQAPAAGGDVVAEEDQIYDYKVDWGDGENGEFRMFTMEEYNNGWNGGAADEFGKKHNLESWWEEVRNGLIHCYNMEEEELDHHYEVSINGKFRQILSNTNSTSIAALNINSSNVIIPDFVGNMYVTGTSGVDHVESGGYKLKNGLNYLMRYGLKSVEAWGTTSLISCERAFAWCEKLQSVPLVDTENSPFAEVENFNHMFFKCASLTDLPYNRYTQRGLFTGLSKAKSFKSAFSYCTGMTGSIPEKLFNKCVNAEDVSAAFAYSKFTGNLPVKLFNGMTNLKNASEAFASCDLNCKLTPDDWRPTEVNGYKNTGNNTANITKLFEGINTIENIYRIFYDCKKISGYITKDFIGSQSALKDMRQAFYNCEQISGITSDAFHNLTADQINCRQAFYNTGIREIPKGLLESLTGCGLMLEKMFDSCQHLTTIAPSAVRNLRVANARGMFGGCIRLQGMIHPNNDWICGDYEPMKRWFGAFADTDVTRTFTEKLDGTYTENVVPIELGNMMGVYRKEDNGTYILYGGKSVRKFPNYRVGQIATIDVATSGAEQGKYKKENIKFFEVRVIPERWQTEITEFRYGTGDNDRIVTSHEGYGLYRWENNEKLLITEDSIARRLSFASDVMLEQVSLGGADPIGEKKYFTMYTGTPNEKKYYIDDANMQITDSEGEYVTAFYMDARGRRYFAITETNGSNTRTDNYVIPTTPTLSLAEVYKVENSALYEGGMFVMDGHKYDTGVGKPTQYSYEYCDVTTDKSNTVATSDIQSGVAADHARYPLGWVYSDVYLDNDNFKSSIANYVGNVVYRSGDGTGEYFYKKPSTSTSVMINKKSTTVYPMTAVNDDTLGANLTHRIYLSTWNDMSKRWVDQQTHAEDISTITNTNDVNVCYSLYDWQKTLQPGFRTTRNNETGMTGYSKLDRNNSDQLILINEAEADALTMRQKGYVEQTYYGVNYSQSDGLIVADSVFALNSDLTEAEKFASGWRYWWSKRPTRYCGEKYTEALLTFMFERGAVNDPYTANKVDANSVPYIADMSVVLNGKSKYYLVGSRYGAASSQNYSFATVPTSYSSEYDDAIFFVRDANDALHYEAYVQNGSTAPSRNASYDVYLNKVSSARYPAVSYCNNYCVYDPSHGVATNPDENAANHNDAMGRCFFADATDGWDLWSMREWHGRSCAAVIKDLSGFTTSNCFPFRTGTTYSNWCSTIYRAQPTKIVHGKMMVVGLYGGQSPTGVECVRPSVAIDVEV